jgi:hypothetical protein
MRKKVFIDRSIPRAELPEELRPDWLSKAVACDRPESDGSATERSLHIASLPSMRRPGRLLSPVARLARFR